MSLSEPHPNPGKRICQVIAVKKQFLEEYKKVKQGKQMHVNGACLISTQIHANVWESVLDGLRRSHIVDYSINFLPSPPFAITGKSTGADEIGGLLIATFKYVGKNFDSDMKRAAEDEETRRWWKVTDGMQHSLVEGSESSEGGGWWYMCHELFRFDG